MQQIFSNLFNSQDKNNYMVTDAKVYEMYPEIFDTRNPNYLMCDNKYLATLYVINYNKEIDGVFLDKILSMEVDIQLSIFYEKQSTSEVIKKITYHIGNTGADMKNSGDNQSDSDVMSTTYYDAKYIRKQLQVGGEELYNIYIYMCIYADSEKQLEQNIQKVEGVASSIGLTMRRGIYRQQDILQSAMPLNSIDINTKKYTKRNVLTSRNNWYIPIFVK